MVDSILSFDGVYTTLMQHTFQSLGGSSVNGFLCRFIEMQALDGVSFEFLSDGPVVCRPTHYSFLPKYREAFPRGPEHTIDQYEENEKKYIRNEMV